MLSTTRPFEQAVLDPEVVDTLKFPRQTLTFRAGDCADLSVLYASCLEAAGVETAFITIPGHIFMAIDLGITPGRGPAPASMDENDLIVQGGKVWLPIETTMRDSGFLEVWKKGADEWRDASAKEARGLLSHARGLEDLRPDGPARRRHERLAARRATRSAPAFAAELAKAVDAELGARGSPPSGTCRARASAAAAALNNRGVLYGKYGRLTRPLGRLQGGGQGRLGLGPRQPRQRRDAEVRPDERLRLLSAGREES